MKERFQLAAVALVLLRAGGGLAAEPITVECTETLAKLSQSWAEGYRRQHPEIKIRVTPGTATAAFAALQQKGTQIALVPRHIKFAEAQACTRALGKRPVEYRVGINGVAVYVNAANPVQALTLDQLSDIFAGKLTNWKSVNGPDLPIALYGSDEKSAAYESFKQEVLTVKDFATGLHTAGVAGVVAALTQDKGGIGFCSLAREEGVHAIGVKRAPSSTPVKPSEETIVDRTYPIMHYLYAYVDPNADKAEVKGYVEWAAGEDGRKLVREAGYYPLPQKLRGK